MTNTSPKRHLVYHANSAHDAGANLHPQLQMKLLNITYTHSTPHAAFDAWIFWNCQGCDDLPDYLRVISYSPMDYIGHGLGPVLAAEILKASETS